MPLLFLFSTAAVNMSENLAIRWIRRYKIFFLLGLLIVFIQIFLAYKSLGLSYLQSVSFSGKNSGQENSYWNAGSDQHSKVESKFVKQHQSIVGAVSISSSLSAEQLGFQLPCEILRKEAISALQRAKTKDCKKYIADVACAIQAGQFYPRHLPSYCPAGNRTANTTLGCFRDEKDFRLLSGYFTNFKTTNTPQRCMQLCLQSGYPYAGVQYGTECFCGAEAPSNKAKLPDSSCNMKCSGSAKEVCGGFYSMNVFETGISKFSPKIPDIMIKSDVERVKIAFLLTLNGRALRQVHRLIRALYSKNHVFFIHVDVRQDYLYRKLLELEAKFQNIHLARKRFATIWGGASLLTMLLQSMQDLLESSSQWDFVINLSESDFPVKTINKLVDFLSANKECNFVKSHGRETQRFIQKQGLDKTFVECDTHMWRIGDRQLPAGMQVDGGSDWVALSRRFVEYVTQAQGNELLQGLLTIFRHTLLPAESFFHTALRNSHFCGTYIDNNLHVTNWKRKLGCKCQYKHVVDWCGCSPNDFKPDDWSRLQSTERKTVYFARKFEPIINQAILLQLEEWLFGPYTSDYINLNSYWQNFYHAEDKYTATDDLTRTIAASILRIVGRKLHYSLPNDEQLIELTHFLSNDKYKGFLVRYSIPSKNGTKNELETRVRPVQYQKIVKNSKFAKRVRNFEVSSDFDQKEQIARNFAKFLGPHTDLILSFSFAGTIPTHAPDSASYTYNLTVLWIDPIGQLQDSSELHIEDSQTDAINFSKATLKHPLTPGVWTVKLIGRSAIFAQTKFLVAPLAYDYGKPILLARSQHINLGSSMVVDLRKVPFEWQQHLPQAEDVHVLKEQAQANAQRQLNSLHNWIDELVGKFFHIRETCSANADVEISTDTLISMPLCKNTAWSSLAPDPKSDIDDLLNRRR